MADRDGEKCPVCEGTNTQATLRYGAPWISDLHCYDCGYDEETLDIEEAERQGCALGDDSDE